jgi:hypothetical protein
MNLTSDDVKSLFKEYSNEFKRLFVPDSSDDDIINSLLSFYSDNYDYDLLSETIRIYVKSLHIDEVVTVKEFALSSGKIRGRALDERRDRNEIKSLMEETQKRMEGFR